MNVWSLKSHRATLCTQPAALLNDCCSEETQQMQKNAGVTRTASWRRELKLDINPVSWSQ